MIERTIGSIGHFLDCSSPALTSLIKTKQERKLNCRAPPPHHFQNNNWNSKLDTIMIKKGVLKTLKKKKIHVYNI